MQVKWIRKTVFDYRMPLLSGIGKGQIVCLEKEGKLACFVSQKKNHEPEHKSIYLFLSFSYVR